MIDFIDAALIISNVFTVALAGRFYYQLHKIKRRPDSYELQEFMSDMINGEGLVRITRVSPVDVVIRARRL